MIGFDLPYLYVSESALVHIGSNNGFQPVRRQAII